MSKINSLVPFLALRFLKSESKDRFLSAATLVAVLGLALGVASLFIALSVIGGFREVYKESILKFNSHIVLTGAGEMTGGVESLKERFPAGLEEEVVGMTPFLYREGMLVGDGKLKGIVIKGVPLPDYRDLSRIEITGPQTSLILGEELRKEVTTDSVRLLFPGASDTSSVRSLKVGGSFRTGLYEYDSSFAFLPLREAQAFFGVGDRISGVEIWLRDPDRAAFWVPRLKEEFDFPYVVLGWRDINENLFRALDLEESVFFLLMLVVTAVASLNVLATLIMLFLRKRKQVAMLRVMGFGQGRLRKIFLFDGLLIGVASLVMGMVVGGGFLLLLEKWRIIPLAEEIYFINYVPVLYSWRNFLLVALSSLGLVGLGSVLTLRGLGRLSLTRVLAER